MTKSFQDVLDIFQSGLGNVSPVVYEQLQDDVNDYGEDNAYSAIRMAITNGANYSYAKSIMSGTKKSPSHGKTIKLPPEWSEKKYEPEYASNALKNEIKIKYNVDITSNIESFFLKDSTIDYCLNLAEKVGIKSSPAKYLRWVNWVASQDEPNYSPLNFIGSISKFSGKQITDRIWPFSMNEKQRTEYTLEEINELEKEN